MPAELGTSSQQICVVRRQKLNGFGEHWGVELPNGKVVDLNHGGVRVLSSEDFAAGRDVQTMRVVDPSKHELVRHRLHQALTAPPRYQLVGMNCEDFANWLSGEDPVSHQVIGFGVAAAVLAIAAQG